MTLATLELETRVLYISPTRRDADITRSLFERAGISALQCQDMTCLCEAIDEGAGVVLLTDILINELQAGQLLTAISRQPAWSDLPVILLMAGGIHSPYTARLLSTLQNVTMLERPTPTKTMVSSIEAGLRARKRQYQIRDQFESIKKAETSIRQLQEQLESALDASQLGTFHCTMPLDKIYWNAKCKEHFWLPPDAEVNIQLFYKILHPADRERTRIAIEGSVVNKKPYDIEYRTVSPEGDIRWVRATGKTYFDREGNPLRFDGTTLDITERKLAESALRETEERFVAMANSIPQLAWMAHADGNIFWYNQRWHDYCGTTFEQAEGWGWERVHDPKELPRVIARWKHSLQTGEFWEDTFPIRRHDGVFRWHLSRAQPFRDEAGNIQLWFGTNTDVTEDRERAEERLALLEGEQAARREAERVSRMKDEFLTTLSHELRTPLNAIYGWTQLLKSGLAEPELVSEAVNVIDRNVRVQTQLIEDLLDMSRVISGKIRLDVTRIELADVIKAALEVVKPAMDAKELRLEQVIDPFVGAVSGDFGRLQQVLWNLLTNAIKFTPKLGRIHILAERVNSHVELSITDTGVGIDPIFLPHLFERFSQADGSITRQHGGLGLGLSIVKSLVELHGGTIRAESTGLGKGATFVIRLPLRVAKSTDISPEESRTQSLPKHILFDHQKVKGVKVLVVDDEPDARELVKRFLQEHKAVVAMAASVAEAEALLPTFEPHIIVSDIGMPGKDGYEFMRHVRQQGIRTPSIALTAFARAEDRIRSIQAGYQSHLPKPVEPAELLAMIASLHESFGQSS